MVRPSPKPSLGGAVVEPLKGLEEAVDVRRTDARAGVRHDQLTVPGDGARADPDVARAGVVAVGVVDQVRDEAFDQHRVARYDGGLEGRMDPPIARGGCSSAGRHWRRSPPGRPGRQCRRCRRSAVRLSPARHCCWYGSRPRYPRASCSGPIPPTPSARNDWHFGAPPAAGGALGFSSRYGRRRGRSLSNPGLIDHEAPDRLVLVVPQSRGDEFRLGDVHGRHPNGFVDELVVDSRPERAAWPGLASSSAEACLIWRSSLALADIPFSVVSAVATEERRKIRRRRRVVRDPVSVDGQLDPSSHRRRERGVREEMQLRPIAELCEGPDRCRSGS